ncbi:MAG: hypothetical protein RIT27_2065 [Pseudomonadota bacterium]|jgi:hypothetical protein
MKPCTQIWFVLMFLTILTLLIGETGLQGKSVIFVLLSVTFLKGQLITDHFMRLRHVDLFWRMVMFGWLFFVLSLIGIAFLM